MGVSRGAMGLLTALIFLSGCGFMVRPSAIGQNEIEQAEGRYILNLRADYTEASSIFTGKPIWPIDPIIQIIGLFVPRKGKLSEVSFTVTDSGSEFDVFVPRLVRLAETRARGLYKNFLRIEVKQLRKEKGVDLIYWYEPLYPHFEYSSAQITVVDNALDVRVSCPDVCSLEIFEDLFEKNPIAPLSPKAKRNWEELKARLQQKSDD